MKKTIIALLASLLLCTSAFAQEAPSILINEQRHGDWFVQMPVILNVGSDEIQGKINQELSQALQLDQALAKLGQLRATNATEGEGITLTIRAEILGDILAITASQQGAIPDGGRDQRILGLNFDLTTGQRLTLADVFLDAESAVAAMEAIALADRDSSGNAYAEYDQVLPMPQDQFSLHPWGIVLHYPDTQLAYFSGRPGSYAFLWHELEGHWQPALQESLLTDSAYTQDPFAAIPCQLGSPLEEVIASNGLLKDPDYTNDHRIYNFESPAMRGVSLLVSQDNPEGQGEIEIIRTTRMDYDGLRTGQATRTDCEALLGEASRIEAVDSAKAYEQLLQEGETLWYDMDSHSLGMHFSQGILNCVMVSRP